jgi:hypothetical protein
MKSNKQKRINLEREIERILDNMKSSLQSYNMLDDSSRWSNISKETQQAKQKIIQTIHKFWTEENDN